MRVQGLIFQIRKAIEARPEVAFAYLFGSVLDSDDPRDVDIAVCLREEAFVALRTSGRLSLEFVIPLEMELEGVLGRKVDLQVLNQAPLPFRARVVSHGKVAIDNDPIARSDFEYLSRYEYFDFRPRREAYLAEVTGA